MNHAPKTLPWHVRAYDHVYIWAGGDYVRRMHFVTYRVLVSGLPVESEYLSSDGWTTQEEFEEACLKYEEDQRARKWILIPLSRS